MQRLARMFRHRYESASLTLFVTTMLQLAHAEGVAHGSGPSTPVLRRRGTDNYSGARRGPGAEPHIAPPLLQAHRYPGHLHAGPFQRRTQGARVPLAGNLGDALLPAAPAPRRAGVPDPAGD